MKRFYCTICKRIKRVRVYPASVVRSTSPDVHTREGTCTWHTRSSTPRTIHTNAPQYAKVGK